MSENNSPEMRSQNAPTSKTSSQTSQTPPLSDREQQIRTLEQVIAGIATGADMDLTDLHADGYLNEADA